MSLITSWIKLKVSTNQSRTIRRFLHYLTHEVGNDTMKTGAFVAKALLSCAQCPEILWKHRQVIEHTDLQKYSINFELECLKLNFQARNISHHKIYNVLIVTLFFFTLYMRLFFYWVNWAWAFTYQQSLEPHQPAAVNSRYKYKLHYLYHKHIFLTPLQLNVKPNAFNPK